MFFPQFTQPQQFFSAWTKMATDNLAKLEAAQAQMKSAEDQQVQRAGEAIDEAAKLMKASLSYWQDMSQAWRKQSVDATKQAATMINPGL
jgi:hypothetical protein